MLTPDRRTLIVLGTLVAAMTLASGVLLLLEPRPVAPFHQDPLMSTDPTLDPVRKLFDTTPAADGQPWSAIVVHFSGAAAGSSESLDAAHQKMGLDGLGYHFVLPNGRGGPDGQIEPGFRWKRQLAGAYSAGPDAAWFNKHALGICLIGDPKRSAPTDAQLHELVWLVRQLQDKFRIPADRVLVQGEGDARAGSLFPAVAFRQQLLSPRR